MIDINKIKYPHINHLYNVEPNLEAFLGRQLYFQKKLDGSNAGFYLDENDNVAIRSRNAVSADKDMYKWANEAGVIDSVKDLLLSARDWKTNYVLFGELYGKGRSPTRIVTYDKPFFVAFDLWSEKAGGFIPYVAAHQQCHHSNIPFVDCVTHGTFSTPGLLMNTLDDLIVKAEEEHIEGYVIKSWDYKHAELNAWGVNTLPLMFKHKVDTPRLEKIQKVDDSNRVILPELPDSEIYGAINRVKMDYGSNVFKNIKQAMPLIAQYVGEECKKHNCSSPSKKLIKYYQDVLKDED